MSLTAVVISEREKERGMLDLGDRRILVCCVNHSNLEPRRCKAVCSLPQGVTSGTLGDVWTGQDSAGCPVLSC